ncbi:MAG: DUF72 domain-containing protein, partial [Planctomycetes bacterium]|nr:DUF72 domain-containing protein [Planctomycetota bacterium]
QRSWLKRMFDLFSSIPLALEVRHATWNRPEIYEWLKRRKIAFCNIDQPQYPNSMAPDERCTAPLGYIRLHGRNHADWFREDADRDARYDYLYSEEELTPWIQKIEKMRTQVEKLYVITNNHYKGQAAVNGLQIAHRTRGEKVKVPPTLLRAYPQLSKISGQPNPGAQEKLPGF